MNFSISHLQKPPKIHSGSAKPKIRNEASTTTKKTTQIIVPPDKDSIGWDDLFWKFMKNTI